MNEPHKHANYLLATSAYVVVTDMRNLDSIDVHYLLCIFVAQCLVVNQFTAFILASLQIIRDFRVIDYGLYYLVNLFCFYCIIIRIRTTQPFNQDIVSYYITIK